MTTSLETIPGEWVCPKCNYFETRVILNPATGRSGPNPTPALPCPNDGEFMVPLTWKQHALDLRKMLDGFIARTLTQHEAYVVLDSEYKFDIPYPAHLAVDDVPKIYRLAIDKLQRNAEGE